MIVAISPGVYKQLQRWVEKYARLVRRYMSTFTELESEDLRILTCPTLEETRTLMWPLDRDRYVPIAVLDGESMRNGVSASQLSERFLQLGGIPRSLLDMSVSTLEAQLQRVLDRCSLAHLVNAEGDWTALDEDSSMLLHYNVFVHSPFTPAQRRAVLDFKKASMLLLKDVTQAPASPPPFPALPFTLLSPAVEIPTKWLRRTIYEHNNQLKKAIVIEHDATVV